METMAMLSEVPALLPVLVEATWKGSVLIVALLVLSRLIRSAPAATRHLVWSAGVVALVVLPLLSAAVPWRLEILPVPGRPAADNVARAGSQAGSLPDPVVGFPAPESEGLARAEVIPMALVETGSATGPADPAAAGETAGAVGTVGAVGAVGSTLARIALPGWGEALTLLWLAGALLVGLRLALGWLAAWLIVHRASPLTEDAWASELLRSSERVGLARPVRLLRSERVGLAFTTGLFRPAVVLPPECDEWHTDRRRAVLMHELAHVRRRDLVTHLLGRAACAIHWFNPLVWLAARRLRAESERACDDLVLSLGTRASDYAGHLLDLVRSAGRLRAPATVLPMAQESEFEGRLLAILEPDARRHAPSPLAAAGILAAVALSALPLAAMAPASTDVAVDLAADTEAVARDLPGDEAPEGMVSTLEGATEPAMQAATDTPEVPSAAPRPSRPDAFAAHASLESELAEAVAHTMDDEMVHAISDAHRFELESLSMALHSAGASGAAMSPAQSGVVVAGLARALDDPEVEVRHAAARALAEYQDTAAVTALMRALTEDEDAEVRATAAWALGQLESPLALPALARALEQDPAVEVRRRAIWALGQIEDRRSLAPLTGALDDADAEIRKRAAWALGQIEDESSVDPLLGALRDSSAEVRSQAAWALGQIESPRAVDGLMGLMDDQEVGVRKMALWALSQIEDPRAMPAYQTALRDESAEIRRIAVRALGDLDLTTAPPALLEAAADADAQVRRYVAWSLGEIEDPAAVPVLARLLGDENAEVRRHALRALGEIGDEAAIQAMVEALSDADPEVRREAARALGRFGG